MADIFVSYSGKDKTMIGLLAGLFEQQGWSVWWDRDIPVGQSYDTVIETELNAAKCVVVIWTANSVKSEWVKNEATAARERGILVPVMLEDITLPLAFSRVECAMLQGWNGDTSNTEFTGLLKAISALVHAEGGKVIINDDTRKKRSVSVFAKGGVICFLVAAVIIFLLTRRLGATQPPGFITYLLIANIGVAFFLGVYWITKAYLLNKSSVEGNRAVIAGVISGVLAIAVSVLATLPRGASDHTMTIRVFDWKKNALNQGDVKIYLKEYVRSQSIDKTGQALFTGLPPELFQGNIKIEVSSPGYMNKVFDTLADRSRQLELVLPLTTVVLISGKVKTAAEHPISNVEINVEGTRYYALSLTDGSFKLRLEEYTLGDEITLTTSHKDYEDKTIAVTISGPDMKGQDIFLNPISH